MRQMFQKSVSPVSRGLFRPQPCMSCGLSVPTRSNTGDMEAIPICGACRNDALGRVRARRPWASRSSARLFVQRIVPGILLALLVTWGLGLAVRAVSQSWRERGSYVETTCALSGVEVKTESDIDSPTTYCAIWTYTLDLPHVTAQRQACFNERSNAAAAANGVRRHRPAGTGRAQRR